METKLKRNISVSYLYNFFMTMDITSAIWILYLSFKGMTLVEIGILESIYHITGLLFELPTGALADLYGRKFCVVLGRAVSVISCILMIISNSFIGYAFSFILSCASMNLHSGAAEALVYDSLKELGEEESYKKIWGRLAFVMTIAQGAAVLLGGILADIKFLYAYLLGGAIQIVAFIISFGFTEPNICNYDSRNSLVKKEKGRNKQKAKDNMIIRQLITSIKIVKYQKWVLYIILFSALTDSLLTTVFFYGQQYFYDLSYSKTAIAFICATGSLIEAFASKYAYKFENRFKERGTLIIISAVYILALAGLALSKDLSVVFFFMTKVAGGLSFTIFSDYINSEIQSEYRATILSILSLCFSLFMIFVFPLFGFMAEHLGFSVTFGLIAVLYVPIIVFLLLKLKKYKKENCNC